MASMDAVNRSERSFSDSVSTEASAIGSRSVSERQAADHKSAHKAVSDQVPLCVDMDGTLLNTDSLIECFFAIIKDWRVLFALVGWLFKGKAHLKQQLALHARLDPALLPYNTGLITWLHEQKRLGRRLDSGDRRRSCDSGCGCEAYRPVRRGDRFRRSQQPARFGQGGSDLPAPRTGNPTPMPATISPTWRSGGTRPPPCW